MPIENFKPTPPGPILTDEYVNGFTFYDVTKYYFFPVAPEDYGNTLILLNKTQIFGYGNNGDSRLNVNIQGNISFDINTANYTNWVYPTDRNAGAKTGTKNNTWPEIIEPYAGAMQRLCGGPEAVGCGLMVGVAGSTPRIRSSYRIKGFRGHNKLHLNTPIKKTIEINREGHAAYDYYWFVINDTVKDST
jgi:hypothetical protein